MKCKWCISFEIEHKGYGRTLDTKFKCSNPKGLFDAQPDDSCKAWELNKKLTESMKREQQGDMTCKTVNGVNIGK